MVINMEVYGVIWILIIVKTAKTNFNLTDWSRKASGKEKKNALFKCNSNDKVCQNERLNTYSLHTAVNTHVPAYFTCTCPRHTIHLFVLLSSPLAPPPHCSCSVTTALRPGTRKQLVCLPGLLTNANLWQERTLTSLPTTQLHIQPALLPAAFCTTVI